MAYSDNANISNSKLVLTLSRTTLLRYHILVTHTDQVVTQLLHHIGRRAWLHMLGVVCKKYRLRRLDNDYAFLALFQHNVSRYFGRLFFLD